MRDLTTLYSIPVIVYDQTGIGRSSHVPEKKDDRAFWKCELFFNELDTSLSISESRTVAVLLGGLGEAC
jgi:hypothetical protein